MNNKTKELLDVNLKEKVKDLKLTYMKSSILIACGLPKVVSTQSTLIRAGYIFENAFNKILEGCDGVKNINTRNKTTKKGTKQVDIMFSYKNEIYYYESKLNLLLDSEKKKMSKSKIFKIQRELEQLYPEQKVNVGYLCPVDRTATNRMRYDHPGIVIHGVEDLINVIGQDNFPFTANEYFDYLLNEIQPVLLEKGFNQI